MTLSTLTKHEAKTRSDLLEVQRDPIGEVHRLYEWLGQPVTEAFEAGMRRWWEENAAGRNDNVHPDPAELGLDHGDMARRFRTYTEWMTSWTTPR